MIKFFYVIMIINFLQFNASNENKKKDYKKNLLIDIYCSKSYSDFNIGEFEDEDINCNFKKKRKQINKKFFKKNIAYHKMNLTTLILGNILSNKWGNLNECPLENTVYKILYRNKYNLNIEKINEKWNKIKIQISNDLKKMKALLVQ